MNKSTETSKLETIFEMGVWAYRTFDRVSEAFGANTEIYPPFECDVFLDHLNLPQDTSMEYDFGDPKCFCRDYWYCTFLELVLETEKTASDILKTLQDEILEYKSLYPHHFEVSK